MMNLDGEEEIYKILLEIIDADLSALDKRAACNDAAHLSEPPMCYSCIRAYVPSICQLTS